MLLLIICMLITVKCLQLHVYVPNVKNHGPFLGIWSLYWFILNSDFKDYKIRHSVEIIVPLCHQMHMNER
jgi:hypothetical protein